MVFCGVVNETVCGCVITLLLTVSFIRYNYRPTGQGDFMLNSILGLFLTCFAFVGLVALVRWIFGRNWHLGYKALGLVVAVPLGLSMISSATSQAWGVDRGAFIALFSTGGVAIVLNWTLRRYRADWRPCTAAIVVAMVLLIGAWSPYLSAGSFSFTTAQNQAARQAPIVQTGPSIQNQPRSRPFARREPTDRECQELAYDDARALNCP